jgi:hypothetical protein
MAFPAGLERSHVDDDPAARIGRLAEADDEHVARHPEIFDGPRQREAVRRDDADVGLAVDEAVGGEILGVDDRVVDVGEDLELVGDAGVVAVGRQAVADQSLALLRRRRTARSCRGGLSTRLRGSSLEWTQPAVRSMARGRKGLIAVSFRRNGKGGQDPVIGAARSSRSGPRCRAVGGNSRPARCARAALRTVARGRSCAARAGGRPGR